MASHLLYRASVYPYYQPSGRLYITTATGSYTVGSTLTITLREDSGTNAITAVQADFMYPAALLQYESMDFSTSAFQYKPPSGNGGSSGTVTLQTSGPSQSADQIVATVTFTVIAAGAASLTFTSNAQLIDGNGNSLRMAYGGANLTLNN